MAQSSEIKKLLLTWKKLKKNIYKSLKENKFIDIQKSLSSFVKDSQSQFNKKVDKDVESLKKKFNKEKGHIEKVLDSTLKKEIKRITKFI